jgi:hypothetical protein
MDENRIRQIIETLETSTEPGNGKSRLASCSPPNTLFLTANQTGLLKLACTLLHAALEPILSGECRSMPVEVTDDHEQVREDTSDQLLVFVQRMETWPEPAIKKQSRWINRVALFGCGIVAFVLLFVFIIGGIAIWKVTFGP